jgi:hypothetical protein
MDLKRLQVKVRDFTNAKGLNAGIETRMLDLSSEVGELSKEVLKGTDYGARQFQPSPPNGCLPHLPWQNSLHLATALAILSSSA